MTGGAASTELTRLLPRICDIVREAAALVRAAQHRGGAVEHKADGSPVTASDRDAHELIVGALSRLDPKTPIVSEEASVPEYAERAGWKRFWLVDPLDGTKEFIAGLPDYTVNVALIEDGEPVLGVVAAPARDVLYFAAKGLGSWRSANGEPPVRIYTRPPAAGAPLRLVESRSHRSAALDDFASRLPVCERVAIGSSLKFCWLAEGRADLYPRLMPIMEWDVAAGDAIYRWASPSGVSNYSPITYNGADMRIPRFVIGFMPPPAAVVWFTGLSGAGKTTIAREVRERLSRIGAAVDLLDGDEIRAMFPGTGFSREARDAHIRRVGYLASRLERHGVTTLAALVSPYRESRDFVRGLCSRFVEVYIATPIDECERRDPKGLYRQARAGEVTQFTGIDDPYEPPTAPELVIDTRGISVGDAADRVLDHLQPTLAVATDSKR